MAAILWFSKHTSRYVSKINLWMQKSLLNSISLFRVVPRAEKLLNQSELKVSCANCLASYLYFIQSYRTTDIWTTEEYLKVPWIPKIIIYIIQLIWDLLYEFLLIDQSTSIQLFIFPLLNCVTSVMWISNQPDLH